jgi:hypothetical protein
MWQGCRRCLAPDFLYLENSKSLIIMKTKKNNQRMNYVVVKEGGVYIAKCSDLDLECRGATEQEAVASLQEALALFYEDLPGPADG